MEEWVEVKVATDYNEHETHKCNFLHSGAKVADAKWSGRRCGNLLVPNDNPAINSGW